MTKVNNRSGLDDIKLILTYVLVFLSTILSFFFVGMSTSSKDKIPPPPPPAPSLTFNLPVNSDFYEISGSIIEGFSTSFLAASDTDEHARQYMVDNAGWIIPVDEPFGISMDLHGQKITGEQYAFSPAKDANVNLNINHILINFTELNFVETVFEWNDEGQTGSYTFGTVSERPCDFSNVRILKLHKADFADVPSSEYYESPRTAYHTFANAIFTNLITLDLSGARFACEKMTKASSFQLDWYISTADNTFTHIVFNQLISLQLNNVIFAVTKMAEGVDKEIRTAYQTFYGVTFGRLTSMSLDTVTFGASSLNIGGPAPISYSLSTFGLTTFAYLIELNLGSLQLVLGSLSPDVIGVDCFKDIHGRSWGTNKKLKISGRYNWNNEPTHRNKLDEWFTHNMWTFRVVA